jgi:TPR repeat protein
MQRAVLLLATMLAASPAMAQTSGGPDGGRLAAPEIDVVDPNRFGDRPTDAAYGAYQRGYYITALNIATPLALAGDAAAQTLIAEIYSTGLGVRRDIIKATEWYGKAADQNVPEAQFRLAMILLDGGDEFGDPERSFSLMEQAANSGHRMAQFNFAQMLTSRDPSTRGLTRAVEYYRKAAEAGLADAQYAMAQVYRFGSGGERIDAAQSRKWLELAAAQNFDTAQIELGTLLVEGEGGTPDPKAGFSWLMRAASAGNPAAQNRVAKLYRAGVGVEPDRVTAVAWYLRARRAGLVDPVMEDQIEGLTEEEMQLAAARAAVL